MAVIDVRCPSCDGLDVVRFGKQPNGSQRYRCNNPQCTRKTFLDTYQHRGRLPEVREQIVEMAMNGSGIRDTSRVLKISQNTVMAVLKKSRNSDPINEPLLKSLDAEKTEVSLVRIDDAEADEMWSFVRNKENQRWLWHAIDRGSGAVLAYVFAPRKDWAFQELKALLEPFGIQRFFTDDWGAYWRTLHPDEHVIGKENTWKIERKHLTFRTRIKRLARRTICFSKTEEMHDGVIGIFINRYEFGRSI
ncbi:IS1 family transposase [Magnetococcales bacterium HHB-1]